MVFNTIKGFLGKIAINHFKIITHISLLSITNVVSVMELTYAKIIPQENSLILNRLKLMILRFVLSLETFILFLNLICSKLSDQHIFCNEYNAFFYEKRFMLHGYQARA